MESNDNKKPLIEFWKGLHTHLTELNAKLKQSHDEQMSRIRELRSLIEQNVIEDNNHSQFHCLKMLDEIKQATTAFSDKIIRTIELSKVQKEIYKKAHENIRESIELEFQKTINDEFTMKPYHEVQDEIKRLQNATEDWKQQTNAAIKQGKDKYNELKKKYLELQAEIEMLTLYAKEMKQNRSKMQQFIERRRLQNLASSNPFMATNKIIQLKLDIDELKEKIKEIENSETRRSTDDQ